jgi:hypothetical protein
LTYSRWCAASSPALRSAARSAVARIRPPG